MFHSLQKEPPGVGDILSPITIPPELSYLQLLNLTNKLLPWYMAHQAKSYHSGMCSRIPSTPHLMDTYLEMIGGIKNMYTVWMLSM